MQRMRPTPARPAPYRRALGRDFGIALILLILGYALPFAVAFTDPHVAALRRATQRPAASLRPTDPIAQAPTTSLLDAPTPTPLAMPDTATVQSDPPTVASLPTLIPIAPTVPAPAVEPSAAPTVAATGVASGPPPILMYHYIRTVDAAVDPLGYDLSVTPELFAQQMAWLAQNGYSGVRVDRLLGCIRGQQPCPAKVVGISFDDGYEDAYTAALPVLHQYGFTASFYIVNNFIGQPAYMNLDQIKALQQAGMEIGAHTIDHLMLTRLDQPEMVRQIQQSKTDLERALGISITGFCYPVGDYDASVVAQVDAAGYGYAVTTRWDDNYNDRLTLPRRRVAGGTSVESFGWIVTNGNPAARHRGGGGADLHG